MAFSITFKWPLAKTLSCAFVAGCLFLGSRGLYQTTEGRYAECARQMMVTRHWLDPVLNGKPHWTKPPLTYLAIMGPMRVAGVNTWTARAYLVPSLLLAICGVWLLGRHLGQDPRLGELSALVFATSFFPLAAGTGVSTDLPLTAFLILAQAFFWRAVRQMRPLPSVYAMWFFMGLAFMTKGPPSLLALPGIVAAWCLLPREQRKALPLFSPGALVLYVITAGTWYAWEVFRNPGLLHYWVHDEVINRSTTDEFRRNPQFYMNFAIYLPVLLFGCWPWGGWLIYLQRKAGFRWLTSVSAGGAWRKALSPSVLAAGVRRWPVETHWSAWAFGFPLLVFCLSRSKLPLYVLPLFGPLAVFIAAGLLRVFGGNPARLWKGATVLALTCWTISVVAKGVLPFFPGDRDMKVLHAAVLGQAPGLQPDRLGVYGNKPLNGLQFYFQKELPVFKAGDAVAFQQWLKSGGSGEKYLILKPGQTSRLKKGIAPVHAEFSPLVDKWLLARVPGAS